jgi:hypothetical protein
MSYDSYELGHSAQFIDEDTGELVVREFDFLEELLIHKLDVIQQTVEADHVQLFLTNDNRTTPIWNKWRKCNGGFSVQLRPNYRDNIATVKPYKDNRGADKPVHYDNITAYMISAYKAEVANGLEADDFMSIMQTTYGEDSIICSRDKDLRQVPGWHYSWECGKQPEIGPIHFDKKGYVEDKGNGKVFGGGEMFFMYQLLVGDVVDNIPGCPKIGHVKAIKLLSEHKTRKDLYMAILEAYRGIYEEKALDHLTEQARLLWLLRDFNDEWRFPYET